MRLVRGAGDPMGYSFVAVGCEWLVSHDITTTSFMSPGMSAVHLSTSSLALSSSSPPFSPSFPFSFFPISSLSSLSLFVLPFYSSLKICKFVPCGCSHLTCSFCIVGFKVGSDSGSHGANMAGEQSWFLMAPCELHSVELCVVLFDAPVCCDGIFCGLVNHNHSTLGLPVF